MENTVVFIEDKETRVALAKEYLNDLEETLYLLSKQCGFETVAVTTPIYDREIDGIFQSGTRSVMACQDLLSRKYDSELYLFAKSEWKFELLPPVDIFRIYRECFHSIVKESYNLFNLLAFYLKIKTLF